MEKIILVSRQPSDHKHFVTLMESLFPESTVEIIKDHGDGMTTITHHLDKEMSGCNRKTGMLNN